MTLSGLDVIARSDDFDDRAASYEFRSWQWALLHALDGKAELRDVAITSGVDIDTALNAAHEAQSAGLVYVVSMTLDEYRRSIGMASPHASVATPSADSATHNDHLSSTDTLGSYESSVPAWMIEHHDPPAEDAHDSSHEDARAAEPVHESAPAYSWNSTSTPAADRDDAVAVHHDDAVVEHHDEAVAVHHDDAVAEHHDDAVAVHDHDEAVAEHQDEAVAEHQDEAVAEHHDDAVAVDDGTPWYMRTQAAPAVAAEEPAAVDHRELPEAAHEPETAVAAETPWYVTSQAAPEASPAVEHPDVTSPDDYRDPYSDRPVEPAAHAPSTNGHAPATSWEPMSLVTNVDETPAAPAFDATSHDVPEGVSIHLSSHSDPHDVHETVEPEPEKGSISFSFAPEDSADANVHAAASELPAATGMPDVVAHETHASHDSHDASDVAAMHDDSQAGEPIADDVHAAAHEAMPDPSTELQPAMSAAQPTPAPAPTTSATADIVGNLISRALTFRIK